MSNRKGGTGNLNVGIGTVGIYITPITVIHLGKRKNVKYFPSKGFEFY